MSHIITTFRIMAITWVICCGIYSGIIWTVGQTLTSDTSQGHLIRNKSGQVIGSRLIAQAFTKPEYLWPRPSAINYAADGAAGSNLSPTNPKLKERAQETLKGFAEEVTKAPIPADLVAASGSGLDPHITEGAALYQAGRIAKARNLPVDQVENLIRTQANSTGGIFTQTKMVNVLNINLALDDL